MNKNKLLDTKKFIEEVVGAYNAGTGDAELPADIDTARSLIPPGTAKLRDFSHIAPEIPEFFSEKCVACMECVTQCPDTAILAKVLPEDKLDEELSKIKSEEARNFAKKHFARAAKYYDVPKKKGQKGGYFALFVDPARCKGCAECIEVCGEKNALKMIWKNDKIIENHKNAFKFFESLPDTPKEYIMEKVLADMMLAERSLIYVGGSGSCMGCGEATALRMVLAATAFVYGKENIGLTAATGCNTVYGSTYPYNPFLVPWTNSLFENPCVVAMGIRARWDQMGWQKKRLWAIGGDGAMLDIGFQPLSRMIASGMDIKALVLDTQVYSNTGGQASTSTFMGQETKLSFFGKALQGKTEKRKELGNIAMMHPDVFVAQTTPAHTNHFYKAVMAANEFPGPAVFMAYSVCQPEHGVGDSMSYHHAKLAVDSRAFPLFIYDPRKGSTLHERLDLKGNPALTEDWYINPKTGEPVDFLHFAKSEGRFIKHFRGGKLSETILKAQEDRLANWRLLQELARIK